MSNWGDLDLSKCWVSVGCTVILETNLEKGAHDVGQTSRVSCLTIRHVKLTQLPLGLGPLLVC